MKIAREPDGTIWVERSFSVIDDCTCAVKYSVDKDGEAIIVDRRVCNRAPNCQFPYYVARRMAQECFDNEVVTPITALEEPEDA